MIIDMNCRYKIVYHGGRPNEGLKVQYVDVRESDSVRLNGLILDREYEVIVQSYYRNKSLTITSEPVEFRFTTPSCLEINQTNVDLLLDLCRN